MSALETKDQADLQRRRRDYLALYGIAVCETDAQGQIMRVLDPAAAELHEPVRVRNSFGWTV